MYQYATPGDARVQVRPSMKHGDSAAAHLIAAIEQRGHRMTTPRRRIADAIDRKHGSFTVESIGAEVPDIGRATVFRTIKLLVEAGAVCKLSMPDGAPVYNLTEVEHHHHHVVCAECGAVDVFEDAAIERLLRAVGRRIPGTVLGHRMEFYVTCQACSEG